MQSFPIKYPWKAYTFFGKKSTAIPAIRKIIDLMKFCVSIVYIFVGRQIYKFGGGGLWRIAMWKKFIYLTCCSVIMNTLSRTIAGIATIILGLIIMYDPSLEHMAYVYGAPIVILGNFILFNKKEDDIEKIKTKWGR